MSLSVLIIEDDEDDYIIMSHYLSKITTVEYVVNWCNDFDDALHEMLKDEHDIYLIDHFLGKGEGIEIIQQVREYNMMKPLILLTGAGNINVDEKAMEMGASDFLVKKEIRVDTLERSLRYAMERYHQQRYIKEQEKKYRSLFELSMEPILILDNDFKVTEHNAAFERVFHNDETLAETLQNMQFKELFKYDFDYDELIVSVRKKGAVQGFKTTMRNASKDIIVILSLARLPQSDSPTDTYHVAINDVSALIEKEQEHKKNEKLSMTGRMARMIAHEVRNPLTNINLALGELRSVTENLEEADVFQSMIERNTERIAKLIDDLLKSARPPELEKVHSILQEILDSAIDFCQDRIALQNVEVKKIFPDQDVEGHWDPEKLKVVFVNIIINAIEAMEEVQQPELSIILSMEDEFAMVYIMDNGKGMDEETQRSIYDPFFTVRKEGLGLGMTATLNIINMHEGKISVRSALDKGTEFKIALLCD
ncbi:MAG: ATP-binding protein [Bacteroidota bacterium]